MSLLTPTSMDDGNLDEVLISLSLSALIYKWANEIYCIDCGRPC